MSFVFAGPAIFGIGQWYQVVNEINRANICAIHPGTKSGSIQASVTDIQIKSSACFAAHPSQAPQKDFDQSRAKSGGRFQEDGEQLLRCFPVEYSSKMAMMNDRLRFGREMLEVTEAYAVDASGMAADPPPPHQSRDIKQQRCVVRHDPYGAMVLAVANGTIEEDTILRNRWNSDVRELAT